jgi:hypothetical protein
MKHDKVANLALLTIDSLLVLMMFVGLFRLRNPGEGMYGLGRLLWQQVRWRPFLVVVVFSIS